MRTATLLLALMSLASETALAQSVGDIAFVGFRAGHPNQYAFVALDDLPEGTEFFITDRGWRAAGGFRKGEGTSPYTVYGYDMYAGNVRYISGPADPVLNTSGDQLIAYIGSEDSPVFLHALNVEGNATWQDDATDDNTSALPTGLVNGKTAAAVQEYDMVVYAGPTTGSKPELLAAIGDPSNWIGSDTTELSFPGEFTITGPNGNRAPEFTSVLESQEIPYGIPFSFDFEAIDFEGDGLTYSMKDAPRSATIDPVTGLFEWTPEEEDEYCNWKITFEVSDDYRHARTWAYLFVVDQDGYRPPQFIDPDYAVLTRAGETVTVPYLAVDPDGLAVSFALTSGDARASVDPTTGTFSWTAPARPGVHPFTITATDEAGDSTTVDLFVGVQGTLFPGLTGADLRRAIRTANPAHTLAYDTALDTLYSRVEGYPDGRVEGVYSGFAVDLAPGLHPSTHLAQNGVGAEHVWPLMRGPGPEPQRSDMHVLYPARRDVIVSRGSDPYGEVPDVWTRTWHRGSASQTEIPDEANRDEWSERGPGTFEPREEVEGDIARAVLYFAAMYEAAADPRFLDAQLVDLLTWDAADRPSAAEVQRSGLIARYQRNVNPFVLDPTLADRAFGSVTTGSEDTDLKGSVVTIGPNPTRGSLAVTLSHATRTELQISVFDVLGRRVRYAEGVHTGGDTTVPLDLSSAPAGTYTVRIRTDAGERVVRVSVLR